MQSSISVYCVSVFSFSFSKDLDPHLYTTLSIETSDSDTTRRYTNTNKERKPGKPNGGLL